MESVQNKTFKIGEHEVEIETGKLARSASGSVTIKCGDNVILVTAVGAEEPRPGIDFFPLLIDYEEKMSSIGKIPGGFLKKEGRPSDKAILICRLIDRPIRPLFPDGYRKDVQVVASALSSDQELQPDTFAIFGASLALGLSGLPFEGPVGAVRVSELDGKFVFNPSYDQANESNLDIVVAGTEDSVIMVEAGCKFVSEEKILEAIDAAMGEIKNQVQVQKEFIAQCGVVKEEFVYPYDVSEIKQMVLETCKDKIYEAYHQFDREVRKELISKTKKELEEKLAELPEDHSINQLLEEAGSGLVSEQFKSLEKQVMRAMILEEGVRADGRKNNEIRPITCEVGLLPRVHGSAVFTRGNTQALSSATLAGPGFTQTLEGVDPQTEKRYMHSYAFPAFSVGEVRPMRGPGRREIGHGALAERAVQPALPSKEEFPYAIRVTSDVLESNGSTSMASTCASCLALMDAGVPLKTVIAGVAMGLVKEQDKTAVLTDIQGLEDFLGDMDFKVTGNREGITALQMDIKIKGLDVETLKTAINEAKAGRLHILDKMIETLAEPKPELSPYAPKLKTIKIHPDAIGALIGPGGKTIKGIVEQTGATIDIEDDGSVHVGCSDSEVMERTVKLIKSLTMKLEPGMILPGKVVRTLPIGAFVEVAPGKDGLVHISKLAPHRVNNVEDVVKLGDQVVIKIIGIDDKGRVNFSIKDVTDEEREAALLGIE